MSKNRKRPNKGIMSEEQKKKLSDAAKMRKPMPEEVRKQISETLKRKRIKQDNQLNKHELKVNIQNV